MLSDDLRRRLEDLNREPLPEAAARTSVQDEAPIERTVGLERLGPARLKATPAGDCYVIARRLSDFWAETRAVVDEYARVRKQAQPEAIWPLASEELRSLPGRPIESALYVDIETCGFAGTPVFLIGMMRIDENDFHFELLLARNYVEESAIICRFVECLAAAQTIVTFNGKSFDVPFLRERAAVHRIAWADEKPHLDLLHEARRAWKDALPDCKLQTLEAYVLARSRRGDIPGAEIPAAYHEFVQTGDARQLADILHHNVLDLTTMGQLVSKLMLLPPADVP